MSLFAYRFPLPTGKCGIAWTDRTLNPGLFGCTKVSDACANCYAERMAVRLARMGSADYARATRGGRWTGRVRVAPAAMAVGRILAVPGRRGGGPSYCLVTSMSDVLHADVATAWIVACIEAMRARPDVVWQVLTKRADRWPAIARDVGRWPANVWPGVTVESEKYWSRIADLYQVPAAVHFVSVEPMLGPLRMRIAGIAPWVIVGGESGEGWRPIDWDAVRRIRDDCAEVGAAFFMKQSSGFAPRKDMGDVPEDLRVREMPRRAS